MAQRPFYHWFPSDYARDTKDLDWLHHGAYRLLLDACWDQPNCSLPADLTRLRRLLPPVDLRTFKRVVPYLLDRFFSLNADGEWVHKRLLKCSEKVAKTSAKNSENAKKRWENKDEPKPSQSYPYPYPDKKKELDTNVSSTRARAKRPMPDDFVPEDRVPRELGWPTRKFHDEVQKFKDHAQQNSRVCADWQAAWRNWCRSPYQRDGPNLRVVSPEISRKERIRDANDQAIAKLERFIADNSDPSGDICPTFGGLLPRPGFG